MTQTTTETVSETILTADRRDDAGAFAAVGSDGSRLVVWGVGLTEDGALRNAEMQGAPADLSVHPISLAQSRLIEAGHVEWSTLRSA